MEIDILGGGYAGVVLTRRLERKLPDDVDLCLIDDSGEHIIQHELHRLIRFPEIERHVRLQLSDILARADVRTKTISEVDLENKQVRMGEQTRSPEFMAICLGARTADYGIPGIGEFGQPLKRVSHAHDIRDRFLDLDTGDTVVVGGAGLSGIQVAGELAAISHSHGEGPEVLLVEQESEVAPRFPTHFRKAVRRALDEVGVRTRTDSLVTAATATGLELASGETVDYNQLIWTGGISGSEGMDGYRPVVRSDLRIDDRIFAMGDAARVVDDLGNAAPASAQTAIRQARVASENISRLVEGRFDGDLVFEPELERYTYEPRAWVVSVGDDAVAQIGDSVIRGGSARALKTSIWVGYLSAIGRIRESIEVIAEEVRQ